MPLYKTLEDGIATLSMELGRGNAIDDAFITAFHGALDGVAGPEVRAVVLTGQGRAFSSGLNLVAIYAFDRAEATRFADAFDGLFERLFSFPKPVVAAINGHAIAGGCILALAADHRIIAPGEHAIGLNEVALGISFPAAAFEIARHALPPTLWGEALLEGRRFSPEEALQKGLVHAIAGERGVVADAVEKARLFSLGAPATIADIKGDLVAPALGRIEATRAARRERFLDRWSAPETRARIGKLRDELVRKRASAS